MKITNLFAHTLQNHAMIMLIVLLILAMLPQDCASIHQKIITLNYAHLILIAFLGSKVLQTLKINNARLQLVPVVVVKLLLILLNQTAQYNVLQISNAHLQVCVKMQLVF